MADELQPVTVLLVDDEENILRSIQRLLMDEDFDVETATSGEAALEKLQTLENVGLIVSDQRMPGMNGAEFLGRSQEYAPHAQRILLTGYSDINATIEAINKGGAGRYLSKPWDDEELVSAIRHALGIYRLGVETRRLNEINNQQKEELAAWNAGLKKRLLQTAATIREQHEAIKGLDEKNIAAVLCRTFDNFFEVMGDRNAVHARTVSILVTDVARKMGLDAETVALFRLAALLHDAGKFGTLSHMMHKHLEDMSESELNDYRQHPARGEEMFSKVEELAGILPLVRGHHEAFDGSGFPDGLRGEAIPLGARLIAIADYIEEAAHSVDQNRADYALMSVKYRGGVQFDPQLVSSFQAITNLVYYEGRKAGTVAEVEVGPAELISGMTIARDVESGGGVLLMQRGNVLDAAGIALIRSHYRKNPPAHGVFVQLLED
ncbi:MAG: response regulator [Desulfuromonadaceae bacterium]|nr:response regulator [Desulfuromonadaceae bacterium]MDD2848020.1 response regulator [Desulfuromonadaceae bacterium]MDD4131238.1 response regulator [Desulfuromonadaceae bacterium]